MKNLTPEEQVLTYKLRRTIFFKLNLYNQPSILLEELFNCQKRDIAKFINEAAFSDVYQFIENHVIPHRINSTHRDSVLMSLNAIFNELEENRDTDIFNFFYLSYLSCF